MKNAGLPESSRSFRVGKSKVKNLPGVRGKGPVDTEKCLSAGLILFRGSQSGCFAF